MSTDLHWRPVDKRSGTLPYKLKKVIAKRFWGHDGSLAGDELMLDSHNLDYLAGLIDAGVEGADELKALILQHGRVVVWIE